MPYRKTGEGIALTGPLAAWYQQIQKSYMEDYVSRGVDDQQGYYFGITFQLLMAAEAKWSKEPSGQTLIDILRSLITVGNGGVSFNPLDVLDFLSMNLDLGWFRTTFPGANKVVRTESFP
jgi:hypothetical protein